MQAFAKDSANMAIGGSGPVNKHIDMDKFHGRGAEGFTDFSTSGKVQPVPDASYDGNGVPTSPVRRIIRPATTAAPGTTWTGSFDPVARAEEVHGVESLGLGTSTFLDGAPAPRSAIRRESEGSGTANNGGGLGRKRSLAQKIRGLNNPRPDRLRVSSPERAGAPQQTLSAGGMPRIREAAAAESKTSPSPFFDDYDAAYEQKGASIQFAEQKELEEQKMGHVGRSGSIGGGEEEFNASASNAARTRAMSSPKRDLGDVAASPTSRVGGKFGTGGALERRITADGVGSANAAPAATNGEAVTGTSGGTGGGGFLSRVKSLKGGKRSRPERSAA